MGAFRNTFRLLAVLVAVSALAPKPRNRGNGNGNGDNDTSSTGSKRRRGGGQSESAAQVQKKARTSAEQLDPDNRSGGDGGDRPSNKDDDSTSNDGERPPLERDENGRPIVDRKDPDQMRQLFDETSRDENGRIPKDELPKGWGYDANGTLHDNRGHKTGHPDEINQSLRNKYYPDGFSTNTHNQMVNRYTREGSQPEGSTGTIPGGRGPDGKQPADGWKNTPPINYRVENGVPVDTATGRPVPRDRLTWSGDPGNPNSPNVDYYRENSDGKVVTNLQYDHNKPAAQHWNEDGYKQSYDERQKWYDNADNLRPMDSKENAGKGSADGEGSRWRYDQTKPSPSEGYTAKPGKE
ncbi:hypothetical protein [Glycomyces paridis]|uniref:Uncharacterized protein n=1 Tax=Glycomyces paridis TaxID=2126555 RepID=A0A4S8PHU3_9ACTN|nr:hypothetical protein [Glycomyces paridis]THV30167.1 hypothetical protein E9998_07290 [Glycomyces paridis]